MNLWALYNVINNGGIDNSYIAEDTKNKLFAKMVSDKVIYRYIETMLKEESTKIYIWEKIKMPGQIHVFC